MTSLYKLEKYLLCMTMRNPKSLFIKLPTESCCFASKTETKRFSQKRHVSQTCGFQHRPNKMATRSKTTSLNWFLQTICRINYHRNVFSVSDISSFHIWLDSGLALSVNHHLVQWWPSASLPRLVIQIYYIFAFVSVNWFMTPVISYENANWWFLRDCLCHALDNMFILTRVGRAVYTNSDMLRYQMIWHRSMAELYIGTRVCDNNSETVQFYLWTVIYWLLISNTVWDKSMIYSLWV